MLKILFLKKLSNIIERLKIKNPYFHNRIGILYDFDNKYLPKGSKMSPYDLDADKLKEFEEIWGSIDIRRNLIHFLMKYRYGLRQRTTHGSGC